MKSRTNILSSISFCLLIAFSSCKKQQPVPNNSETGVLSNCMLVLNEGLFQQNSASLSKVDFATNSVNPTFFEAKTGRPLGDTGNDIQVYDNKIFIVMNVSSTIEILNAQTGLPIKQVKMVQNGTPKQPRFITFHLDRAYISCYDGYVDVLDLNNLTILNRIKVGDNPEQLVVANDKLYVSNSGGLNFPNLDSTVSVISLATEMEVKKIAVGKNPGPILVDSEKDLYVISRGDFANIPSRMHRISSLTDTREQTFSFEAEHMCLADNDLLVSFSSGSGTKILKLNTVTENMINSDFGNFSSIQTFYGMQFSSNKQRLYCFDAQGYVNTGFVCEFDIQGNFIRKFNVGLLPNHIILYD